MGLWLGFREDEVNHTVYATLSSLEERQDYKRMCLAHFYTVPPFLLKSVKVVCNTNITEMEQILKIVPKLPLP